MTATKDVRSSADQQVSPPRVDKSVRLLLKVAIPLTIAALAATLASYHHPGIWQPQDLVRSVALVASLGGASVGLMIVHHMTWYHPRAAVMAGATVLGLVAYVAIRLSVVAAHGLYYRIHIRTPWMNGWAFSLSMTALSALFLWGCALVPVVAAVVSLRRRRAAAKARRQGPTPRDDRR